MSQMSDFKVDTAIIGAGVIGLAIANELSNQNKDVLVIEAQNDFGKLTSSRNSGVIHAGIYYPEKSLKSKFCVLGNKLMYDYCKKNHIPHTNTKKILYLIYVILIVNLKITVKIVKVFYKKHLIF